MRPGFVRRPRRMNDRQMPPVPQRLQRLHRRVETEKPVQIDDLALLDRDRRPHLVVVALGVGHDHIQPIHRAALEEHHQALPVCLRGSRLRQHRSGKKARNHGGANDGHRPAPHKSSPRDRHKSNLPPKVPASMQTRFGGASCADLRSHPLTVRSRIVWPCPCPYRRLGHGWRVIEDEGSGQPQTELANNTPHSLA